MQLFKQFPIDTPAPQIQVVLPVGKHTLQLKVQDDAGEWSDPVTVVIDVVQKPAVGEPPQIVSLVPDTFLWKVGVPWFRQKVTIGGTNLDQPTVITFKYVEQQGVGGIQIPHDTSYLLQPNGTATLTSGTEDRIKLVDWTYAAPSLALTLEIAEAATSDDHGKIIVSNAAGGSQPTDFFVNQQP